MSIRDMSDCFRAPPLGAPAERIFAEMFYTERGVGGGAMRCGCREPKAVPRRLDFAERRFALVFATCEEALPENSDCR